MKNRLMALAALALLSLPWSSSCWAGKLEQIKKDGLRVCLEPGYMPFIMLDKQGKIVGFDPDLAELTAKELGAPKLELINTPWNDIIPTLIADKCDIIMSGMSITEERRQKIDFSNAYIVIGQTVLLRKDLEDRIKSYGDLNDQKYKVASKQGTTGEAAVKTHIPKAQYLAFKTEQEGVTEVLGGKIDAFIYDSPSNAVAVGQRGEGKLVLLDSPFTFEPIGWAIRKGDPEFLNWLNTFIRKIDKDGTKHTIYRKWFKSAGWLKNIQ